MFDFRTQINDHHSFQLICSIFCILIAVSRSELSCRNENNQFVDWFVGLKPPNKEWFQYFSSQNETSQWKISGNITDNSNIFSVTLEQAYNSKSTGSFVAFYSDKSWNGHLKGIINFDEISGYWIIHSVPNFPVVDKYEYSKSGIRLGQSFICVSLNISNLEQIVDQLLMMQPLVYDNHLPDLFLPNLTTKLKELIKKRRRVINQTNYQTISMSTINGTNLVHIGKSKSFENDLYSELIAPHLNSSIKVETWVKGKGDPLPSYCNSTYKVYKVTQFKLNGTIYNTTQDHSKWAVSDRNSTKFICIGDINRMKSQFKRGGGSLCIYDDTLWSLFNEVVEDFEDCPENQ